MLFSFGCLHATLLFWFIPEGYPLLDSAAISLIGFTVFGPQMLIGVAAAELSHKKAAPHLQALPAVLPILGLLLPAILWGKSLKIWAGMDSLSSLLVCSVISILLLLPLWGVKTNMIKAKRSEQKAAEPQKIPDGLRDTAL